MKKIKFEWEEMCDQYTHRAKVIGGWIVRSYNFLSDDNSFGSVSECLVFIPDPKHEWEIE